MRRYEWPLLFAIFLDMVGFGMAFPDIQTRAEQYFREAGVAQPGFLIGLLLSSYFVTQILASPKWGAWSDRIGRKPVLVLCTVLSAASMAAYATFADWEGILFSRLLAGLAAANVVVAQAYIADTTNDEQRTKAMGRVGAVLMLGLVAGPAFGGWLSEFGDQHYGSGNVVLGWTAAGASLLGSVWIAVGVPHVPPSEERRPGSRKAFDITLLKEFPSLGRLFLISGVGWFALACLEGTFGRLIRHKMGLGQWEFGLIFSYESLLGALISWFLLAWLTKRVRDENLLRLGYVASGVGLAIMPFAPSLAYLFLASTLYAGGSGVANPTISSLCSQATPDSRQGEMFGLLQGARSFGFILGPTIGGLLFEWMMEAPYLLAGTVAILAAALIQKPKLAAA